MKSKFSILKVFIAFLFVISPIFNINVFSESGPTRPGGSPIGGSGGPVGGNAPIDGGFSILLILSAAYGLKKTYSVKKEE